MGRSPQDIHIKSIGARKVKRLHLPMSDKDALSLHAGESVALFGKIVTGRDMFHRYLFSERPPREEIPFDIEGTVLYHCGPIVREIDEGYEVVAAGPTTSMRVEEYAGKIIADYGLRGIMGKGGMGKRTLKALVKCGGVYLHTIGGAAVYLAERVDRVIGVWKYEEFGMAEAMWILEVRNFPAIVTMDAHGKSLHDRVQERSCAALKSLFE